MIFPNEAFIASSLYPGAAVVRRPAGFDFSPADRKASYSAARPLSQYNFYRQNVRYRPFSIGIGERQPPQPSLTRLLRMNVHVAAPAEVATFTFLAVAIDRVGAIRAAPVGCGELRACCASRNGGFAPA
jgi:hypothetical protein